MKGAALVSFALITASSLSVSPKDHPAEVSDQQVIDAYYYMLGRWAVLRQETADLKKFHWNEIVHRAPREAAWANPDPNVLYSEAWVYVDASSCTNLTLPEMSERHFTVQVLNGWGEVVAEISRYRYPQHPTGIFALCLQGVRVPIAAGTQRISLPAKKSRLLMRIELSPPVREAMEFQKQVTLRATGAPKIDPIAAEFDFTDDRLPGVDAFDQTEAILESETDVNKGLEALQTTTQAVAAAATDPKQRARIDSIIREQAIPGFLAAIPKMGPMANGWVYPRLIAHYQDDYLMRSIADFTGLWASNGREAIYFGDGGLDGNQIYTQTFPRDALPIKQPRYRWSVAVIDGEKFRALPDSQHRSLPDRQIPLKYNPDGSLTLAFAPQLPTNIPQSNWLPTPQGKKYAMAYRAEGLSANLSTAMDDYYPPALVSR